MLSFFCNIRIFSTWTSSGPTEATVGRRQRPGDIVRGYGAAKRGGDACERREAVGTSPTCPIAILGKSIFHFFKFSDFQKGTFQWKTNGKPMQNRHFGGRLWSMVVDFEVIPSQCLVPLFTAPTLHSFGAVGASFGRQTTWLGVLKTREHPRYNAPRIIANGALTPKPTRSTSGVPKLYFRTQKCLLGVPSFI